MITPTLVGFASIGVALGLYRLKAAPARLFLIFLPIFLFLALRYNYGNDYPSYMDLFWEIASLSEMSYEADDWHAEIGWLALNRMFAGIGFFPMIMVLALFNCYIYARFVRKFVPERYYWLAIFLYVFLPDNMLVQASAMRQAVAMAIFLLAVEFLIERRLIAYVLCIVVAALFHTSAAILLPVYMLGARDIPIKKWMIPFSAILYVGLLYFSDQIVSSLFAVFAEAAALDLLDRYFQYEDKGVLGSGLGMLFLLSYLITLVYFHDDQTTEGKVLFRLVMIGLYLMPLASSLMMLGRFSFYFSVVTIAAVPLIASSLKTIATRLLFVSLHIFYAAYLYFSFFSSPVWRRGFGEYTSILSLI